MNILLVRLRLIGDVASTTPLLRALRRRYPDARLSYLVEPLAADIVRDNPALSHVYVAAAPGAPGRWWADLRLARQLRRARFDVAIDLHGGPRASWLTWASRAPRRVGYAIRGRAWMYTEAVVRSTGLTPRHAVRNQWDLLAPFGVPDPDPARDPVEIAAPQAATARVDAVLADAGVTAAHTLIVIHPGAGSRFRQWPSTSFAALAARLAGNDRARRVVLLAGPDDASRARGLAEDACRRIGAAAAGRVVSAVFPLAEIPALVGRAAVYIGGDTGPLHMTGATTTPVVGVFGATLPEQAMPWRDPRWHAEAIDAGALPCRPCRQRVCAPGDFRCLTRIGVDRVAAAAERAIASGHAAARGADGLEGIYA